MVNAAESEVIVSATEDHSAADNLTEMVNRLVVFPCTVDWIVAF